MNPLDVPPTNRSQRRVPPADFLSYVDALPNSGEDTYSLEAALGGPGHRRHDPA